MFQLALQNVQSQKQAMEQLSLSVIQNTFLLGAYLIFYIRNIFQEDAFESSRLEELKLMRLLSVNRETYLINQIFQKGVFDALEKKYVRLLFIEIKDKSDRTLECYKFGFYYQKGEILLQKIGTTLQKRKEARQTTRDLRNSLKRKWHDAERGEAKRTTRDLRNSLKSNGRDAERGEAKADVDIENKRQDLLEKLKTRRMLREQNNRNAKNDNADNNSKYKEIENIYKESLKKKSISLFHSIIDTTNNLSPLPEKSYIVVKMMYHDCTPADYSPPLFADFDHPVQLQFAEEPVNYDVGKMKTGFHALKVNLHTICEPISIDSPAPQMQNLRNKKCRHAPADAQREAANKSTHVQDSKSNGVCRDRQGAVRGKGRTRDAAGDGGDFGELNDEQMKQLNGAASTGRKSDNDSEHLGCSSADGHSELNDESMKPGAVDCSASGSRDRLGSDIEEVDERNRSIERDCILLSKLKLRHDELLRKRDRNASRGNGTENRGEGLDDGRTPSSVIQSGALSNVSVMRSTKRSVCSRDPADIEEEGGRVQGCTKNADAVRRKELTQGADANDCLRIERNDKNINMEDNIMECAHADAEYSVSEDIDRSEGSDNVDIARVQNDVQALCINSKYVTKLNVCEELGIKKNLAKPLIDRMIKAGMLSKNYANKKGYLSLIYKPIEIRHLFNNQRSAPKEMPRGDGGSGDLVRSRSRADTADGIVNGSEVARNDETVSGCNVGNGDHGGVPKLEAANKMTNVETNGEDGNGGKDEIDENVENNEKNENNDGIDGRNNQMQDQAAVINADKAKSKKRKRRKRRY